MSKYNFNLKTALQDGLSELEFYGNLVYTFQNSVGKTDFSGTIKNTATHYTMIGYSMDILRITACILVNPNVVDNLSFQFNCTTVCRSSK